jgi:alpha-tubulin suppressor-like RCC1 family protein
MRSMNSSWSMVRFRRPVAILAGAGVAAGCAVAFGVAPANAASALAATSSAAIAMANTGFATQDGVLYGWGDNAKGELGDGTTTARPTPVAVQRGAIPDGVAIVQLAAATDHTLALGSDGKVYAWGTNNVGQLGDGTTTNEFAPVAVAQGAIPSGVTIVKVVATQVESIALGSDGVVYEWGEAYDSTGKLGEVSPTNTPVALGQGQVPTGVKIVDVASSNTNLDVAMIGDDGNAYALGNTNSAGQLGSATTTLKSTTPVLVPQGAVPGGVKLVQITAGGTTFEALGDDGHVYGWGSSSGGQLGNATTTSSNPAPVAAAQGTIPGGVKITNLASLSAATIALGDDGNAYAWGGGSLGQLGGGTSPAAPVTSPVAVSMPAGVTFTAVAGQQNTVAALGSDGNVYTWGSNVQSEIGDGTTGTANNRNTPTKVALPTPLTATATTLAVSGTQTFGQSVTLTATVAPAVAGTVQFMDGATALGSAQPVTSGTATLSTSTLAVGDHSITAVFTPTDTTTYAGSTSAAKTVTIAAATLTKGTPTITGTAQVGSQVTANAGTWTSGTTFTYQWLRGGTAISGATASTYTPVAADAGTQLSVTVTGSLTGYTPASATSAAVSVAGATLTKGTPTITGTPAVGTQLTANTGTWTSGTTFTYQWLRGSTAISGATSATYTPVVADAGTQLTVTVTGSLTGYTTASATSAAVTVPAATLTKGTPTINGTPAIGTQLTANTGTWTSGTTFTYQWLRGGTAISGATSATYTPVAADGGTQLTVTVTGSLTGYTTASATSAAVTVPLGTLTTATPTISGTPKVGATLTAAAGTWTSGTTFAYQWLRDGQEISGATGTTYTAVAADANHAISVQVTGSLAGYTTQSQTSAATAKVAPATVVTHPTTVTEAATVSAKALKGRKVQISIEANGLTGSALSRSVTVKVAGVKGTYTVKLKDGVGTLKLKGKKAAKVKPGKKVKLTVTVASFSTTSGTTTYTVEKATTKIPLKIKK